MIPKSYPTVFLDRAMDALEIAGEMIIGLSLSFPHRIDENRLSRAVKLTMEAEPILRCALVRDDKFCSWQRLEDDGIQYVQKAEDKQSFDKLVLGPLSVQTGPALRVFLGRLSDGDRIFLKVAHQVADADAVKRIAGLLSSIYIRLKDEPDYQPEPNIDGDRHMDQVRRHIPLSAHPRILCNLMGEMISQKVSPRRLSLPLPTKADTHDGPLILNYAIPKKDIKSAGVDGATINDIILAASFRALVKVAKWNGKTKLGFNQSVDLRRYLPDKRADGVCNLSGIEEVSISSLGANFKETQGQVMNKTRPRKRGWIGLNLCGSPLFKLLQKIPNKKYKTIFEKQYLQLEKNGKVAHAFSNMGVIPSLDFDGPYQEAFLLPPTLFPPGFGFGLSGTETEICLSAYTYPQVKEVTDQFLKSIVEEISP